MQTVRHSEPTDQEVMLPKMESVRSDCQKAAECEFSNIRGETTHPNLLYRHLASNCVQIVCISTSRPVHLLYHTRNSRPVAYTPPQNVNMRSPIITISLVAAAASSAMGTSSPVVNDAVAQPRSMDAQANNPGAVMSNNRRELPVSLKEAGIPIAIGENNVGPHARRQLLGSLLGGGGGPSQADVAPPPSIPVSDKSKPKAPDASKYDTISDDLMDGEEKSDLPPPKKASKQKAGPAGPPPPAASGQTMQAAARPPAAVSASHKRSERKADNGKFAR